jgi:hypothetical protein
LKYLQIPDYLLIEIPDLVELIWNLDYDNYIIRGQVHIIPETHPNIAFILLKLSNPRWLDEKEKLGVERYNMQRGINRALG